MPFSAPQLPPLRPRLIGLDLDGTVIDGHGELRDSMLAALLACRAAGIELAFLTGRRPRTARLALERYPDVAHVCTNSGCLLWEYPAWRRLGAQMFPPELLSPVLEELAPHSVNLYHDADEHEQGFVHLRRVGTLEMEEVRARYGGGTALIESLEQLDGWRITQLALPCSGELAAELRDKLRARFGARLLALALRWPLVPCMALEVYHPLAHKGSALELFARRLGVPQAQTMAAGDDANDLAMLSWAGWGVAMPHAQAEVRDLCDVTLPGPDGQAALADYLQRLARM